MASFRYRGRRGGELIEGQLDAASRDAVAAQLLDGGVTPVDIAEVLAGGPSIGESFDTLLKGFGAKAPDLTEVILFTRQIYTLMRAGVPINQAIAGLIRSTRNATLVEALRDIHANIESGRELSNCLARHPRIFSTLFVAIVRVGENTGRLDEALLQIAQYLELEKDTRQRIKSALRYPTMVLLAIGVAVSIINIFVIPAFARMFERAGVDLPLPTRILIGTSNVFVAYWPVMLIALALAVFGVRAWVNTDDGRLAWDRFKLRLPIIGDILLRATLGRFARSFAMALQAGVPLIQALTVISRAVDNVHIGNHILAMRTGIERGDSLSRTAQATGMFTPMVIQMLTVGEETGSVDDLMAEVAGFYEREVDYDIRNLSQTIEPIMITVIAGFVLILALGVFLPMWDLASVKLRR